MIRFIAVALAVVALLAVAGVSAQDPVRVLVEVFSSSEDCTGGASAAVFETTRCYSTSSHDFKYDTCKVNGDPGKSNSTEGNIPYKYWKAGSGCVGTPTVEAKFSNGKCSDLGSTSIRITCKDSTYASAGSIAFTSVIAVVVAVMTMAL